MSVELSKMASQVAEAAEKMSEQRSAGGQAATSGQVQEQDANQFREAMNQQAQMGSQASQSPQTAQPAQAGQVSPTAEPQARSMGDAILDKLQQVSQQNSDALQSIENVAQSDDDISVGSMLKVQTELMKVQLTEEVETKAEGKVDQTLDTLLKS